MIVTLFFVSLFGGFVSGFLGLGGAVIMIPMMLTVPSLIGVGLLSMKIVSGLSMVQVFFSSLSGVLVHRKNKNINETLLLYIGIPMAGFSLLGSYASKFMADKVILIIFAIVTISAFLLLLFDKTKEEHIDNTKKRYFNKSLSVIIGIMVGTLSGIVGIGGGFILIPLMITFLKVPIRVAVGTSLGIVLLGAFFGSIGKFISFQVEYILVIPVVLGSVIASRLGAHINNSVSSLTIKYMLLIVIIISIILTVLKIIGII